MLCNNGFNTHDYIENQMEYAIASKFRKIRGADLELCFRVIYI